MFKLKKDRINFKKKLGKGASGAVYAYQKDPDDLKWVVKRMHVGDSDELLSCLPEIVLGFSCDHPCIVPLKGYSIEKGDQEDYYIFLKFPRMRETLKDKFDQQQKSKDHLPEKEIVKYFYSLVCAVDYLHKKKIYHRDIKPGNILLDDNENAKLSDIGAAKHVIEEEMYQPLSGLGGTVDYTAPELLKDRSNLTKESLIAGDAWSIGVVMLELCALKNRLFSPYSQRETIQEDQNSINRKLKEVYTKPLVDLMSKLLNFEPKARINVSDVKRMLEEEYNCRLSSDPDGWSVETLKEKQKAMLESYKKSLQEMMASVSFLKQEKVKVENEIKEYRSFLSQYQSQITSEISQIYTQSIEKLRAKYENIRLEQLAKHNEGSIEATSINEKGKSIEENKSHQDLNQKIQSIPSIDREPNNSVLETQNKIVLPELRTKVIVVGAQCSGESNVVFALKSYPYEDYYISVSANCEIVDIFRHNRTFSLEIYDLPGHEEYEVMDEYYMVGKLVLMVVYSIADRDSFSNVKIRIRRRQRISNFSDHDSIFFIVGAQSDRHNERVVTREEGEALAAEFGAVHMEVSARKRENIDELRERIVDEIEKKFVVETKKTEKTEKKKFWGLFG